jgi:hypothetical protein
MKGNCLISGGVFHGADLEPGVFHGAKVESGVFHRDERIPPIIHVGTSEVSDPLPSEGVDRDGTTLPPDPAIFA